ncbi:hypothetical protein L226DRAFT_576214 [Lentinus tigrinus ALCF2SS1-7]|uniref:F-box domain-containing protein n=1 Tax=Lentinus tigrinus ALCF2SS1-6 TaxID=1328759 RepID=A0A5C2RQG1_9APHY|nr:hypothetical protein L227DRAFT_399076 [Lentinus tigrinus ALCF2SS1-6]RPD68655.1 hypothetical protein L226DRAFT_576214 [Lentinus tigrinus ALCF2SS1-7]
MPTEPALNLDSLLLIMSLSERREISVMMKTCKLLHGEGSKFLLRGSLRLHAHDKISSFVAFMTAPQQSHRFHNSLNVRLDPAASHSPNAMDPLVNFFKEFGHLLQFHTLNISGLHGAERILQSFPDLRTALSGVRYIGHLRVLQAGPLTTQMLKDMRGEVARVTVDLAGFDAFGDDTPPDGTETNPALLLRPFRECLRSFRGSGFAGDLGNWRSNEDITFPHVHTLSLGKHDPLNVPHYAHAFPNITSLSTGIRHRYLSWSRMPLDEARPLLLGWRRESKSKQLVHGAWSALAQLHGTLPDLWVLGLDCEVERLTLTICESRPWDPGMLADVLHDSRGAKYLDLYLEPPIAAESSQDIVSVLEQFSGSLQVVQVSLQFHRNRQDGVVDVSAILDALVKMVEVLRLRFFAVSIMCGAMPDMYLLGGKDNPGTRAGAFLWKFDVPAFADRLTNADPSLHGLQVRLSGRGPLEVVQRGDKLPIDVLS